MVLFVTIFSFAMVSAYLHDFNVLLGDSYAVNQASEYFELELNAFMAYANQRTEESKTIYEHAKRNTRQILPKLRMEYGEMSLNRYFFTRAILISYDVYLGGCDRSISADRGSNEFIEEYYASLKIARYISEYINELMDETLDEGVQGYNRMVEQFKILPVIAVMLAAVTLIFAVMLGIMTIRHVIGPVIRLARAAGEIAENNFAIPDINVENHDEIGKLVRSFNIMKRSMVQSIAALREASEMKVKLHEKELQRIGAEQELKTMQISMLQSQINPHFLFNTFNTIRITAKIENAKSTEELIQSLSNLFRYNIQTENERVTLSRELTIIRDYIYIQKKRFGHRLEFEIDCKINAEKATIPTFTLQPIVENAIIHGISPKEEGGRIRIRIRERNGSIRITVTDNGLGIPPERVARLLGNKAQHKGRLPGIGVDNVRTRLEMLYPNSIFSIRSHVGLGTSVELTIFREGGNVQNTDSGRRTARAYGLT